MDDQFSDRLRAALTPPEFELIQRVAEVAGRLGMPLYIVGGFPRDLLLGQRSTDLDLVTEGKAIKLAEALAKDYGGKVRAHGRFGTAKWLLRGSKFDQPAVDARESERALKSALDFVTARSETYEYPAALPTVRPDTIEGDLKRRDFTINALAIRLDGAHFGELRDDLQGLEDIQARTIRVLHARSFIDDPTRMVRAARYERRYDFHMADDTLALIPEGRAFVEKLSPQRARNELDLILKEPLAPDMLVRLDELGLLQAVHPMLTCGDEELNRLRSYKEPPAAQDFAWEPPDLRWVLWLMALPAESLQALNERLGFRRSLLDALLDGSQLFSELPSLEGLRPGQAVDMLDRLPLLAVYAVSLVAGPGRPREILEQYLMNWRAVRPKTTGDDLREIGLEPGPVFQTILHELRDAWLEGRVGSLEDEKTYLRELLDRGVNKRK